MKWRAWALAGVTAVALAACGGGSSSSGVRAGCVEEKMVEYGYTRVFATQLCEGEYFMCGDRVPDGLECLREDLGAPTGEPYSPEIRDAYLEGCGGSQNAAFCECTLTELEKRFTQEEFIAFAIEASEEPPEEFVEITLACLSEVDVGS